MSLNVKMQRWWKASTRPSMRPPIIRCSWKMSLTQLPSFRINQNRCCHQLPRRPASLPSILTSSSERTSFNSFCLAFARSSTPSCCSASTSNVSTRFICSTFLTQLSYRSSSLTSVFLLRTWESEYTASRVGFEQGLLRCG